MFAKKSCDCALNLLRFKKKCYVITEDQLDGSSKKCYVTKSMNKDSI